jgi:Bacterial archaeo-eukaryotic release factor family 2
VAGRLPKLGQATLAAGAGRAAALGGCDSPGNMGRTALPGRVGSGQAVAMMASRHGTSAGSPTLERTVDIAELRELVRPLTSVASVYLGGPEDDPAGNRSLRLRALLASLERLGADPSTLDAVREGATASSGGCALVIAGGTVRFAGEVPDAAWSDQARFAAPASVTPLLDWRTRHPAYVVVVADRAGAEVTSVARGHTIGHTQTVAGPDDEIQHSGPAGGSQPRHRRRVEQAWRHNAMAVAGATLEALRRVGARLLLIAGDERAVQLLTEHLPHDHGEFVVRHLPGGRSPDGSALARRDAITQAVADYVAAQTDEVVARLREGFGRGGAAVEGEAETLAALAAGRVRTLVLVDDPGDDRTAWFGPGTLCSERGHGDDESPGRLVDVAVRAALLADAEVRVLPRDRSAVLAGGIGALCRFPDPTG